MPRKRGRIDYRDEASEVALRYRSEKVVWRKQRLLVIKLLLDTDKTEQEVADIVDRSRSIIQGWVKKFRQGGLEALMERGNSGGRKSRMSSKVKGEMIQKLREGAFRTAKQFQKWLSEEHQVDLSEKGVYYHLGKLGGCLKAPRPTHIKKDEARVKEFKEHLAEKLIALDLPKNKSLKLWVYDEMRYGLHPLLRKMWSLRGHRVVAPTQRRYEWGYVFGAIEVESGDSEFLYTDRVLKDFDKEFLNQISRNDPESIHVIIGDGAGFHHKETDEPQDDIADNIRVLTLPPYSPELNPIEKLWDIVKDNICTQHWESLSALEDKITEVLASWWKRAKGFSSLFRGSYLRSELNVIWN